MTSVGPAAGSMVNFSSGRFGSVDRLDKSCAEDCSKVPWPGAECRARPRTGLHLRQAAKADAVH